MSDFDKGTDKLQSYLWLQCSRLAAVNKDKRVAITPVDLFIKEIIRGDNIIFISNLNVGIIVMDPPRGSRNRLGEDLSP